MASSTYRFHTFTQDDVFGRMFVPGTWRKGTCKKLLLRPQTVCSEKIVMEKEM